MTSGERLLSGVAPNDAQAARRAIVAHEPAAEGARWMRARRDQIRTAVDRDGWVLIRGIDAGAESDLLACIEALGFPIAQEYSDLPMSAGLDGPGGVFEVTPFPPEEAILFHHEGSHLPSAPRYICFQCVVAASQGGETPLADSADVLDDLPVAMRDELAERGLLYRRHFVAGVDVPWQRFFGTSDRRAVDEQCRVQGIRAVWRTDGSLCIETRRPSVVCHPSTGRRTFFNQILLHHAHCLDPEVREALALGLPGGEMPRDVRFGDGLPIPNDWIDRILEAYSRVAIAFSWKPGDIVICDNVTVAHARRPYAGARRHRVVLSQFHKCEDNP